MENKQKIDLIKERDFSENFNVLFDFLKQNYGKILKGCIWLIPLVMLSTYLMLPISTMEDIDPYAGMSGLDGIMELYASIYTGPVIFGYILWALTSIILSIYTTCYFVQYLKSENGVINTSDVWSILKKVILPLIGASIIVNILISIGLILCVIPGIIIAIYLIFYQFTYTNENHSITDSLSRSKDLVKDNWFSIFGFMIVVGILLVIIYFVFSIPSSLSILGSLFGSTLFTSKIFIYITSLIAYLGSFLITPIGNIAIGILYTSRIAEFGSNSIEQRIDNIGSQEHQE